MSAAEFTRLDPVPRDMVFDCLLPREMLAKLRSGSGGLVVGPPGTRGGAYRFRRQRALLGAAIYCGAMALIVTVELVAGTFWSWAAGAASGFAYVPANQVDRRADRGGSRKIGLGLLFPWSIWAGFMSGVFAGTVIAQYAMLHLIAYGLFIGKGRGGATHVVGRDQIISPEDLRPLDRGRLGQVQNARRWVEEAQRVLAPAFDGTPVLRALAEEEWRLAVRMKEMAPPAAEHAGLIGLARSDEGVRPLDGVPRLAGDLDLEAARLAREELTAEVLEANTWLLGELRGGGKAANG